VETGISPAELVEHPEMLVTLYRVLEDKAEAQRKAMRR
jgi:hypothetical protein